MLDFNDSLPADGTLLTIDDGTDRNRSVTFEFDANEAVVGGLTPLATGSTSNLLDDLTAEGNLTHYEPVTFVVEIDATGSPDTFRWSKDGGQTFVDERVEINSSSQPLAFDINVTLEQPPVTDWETAGASPLIPANIIIPLGRGGYDTSLMQISHWFAMP